MDDKVQFMTQEKLDELNKEYTTLKKEKTQELANRIDEARQMGDLSENAEYHAAREEMGWVKGRIIELEQIIEQAKVIEKGSGNKVQLGSTIVVKVNGNEFEYTIVGAQEADPLSGKISNESPLGNAFLGKKKKDVVSVEVPAGILEYTILKIK